MNKPLSAPIDRRRRTIRPAGMQAPPVSATVAPPCHYRAEFAGFPVCRAMDRVAIATATDCRRCPVPETRERTGCPLLRASVELVPEVRVVWTCGATNEQVDPDSPDGCLGCRTNMDGTATSAPHLPHTQ